MSEFVLHPQLAADTVPVARLDVCDVLLVNDARYVWCLLVPRFAGLRNWNDVPDAHKPAFHREINQVCAAVEAHTRAFKMNVAALGNLVDQLHVHVVARHPNDAAWPGPVWGVGEAKPYANGVADELVLALVRALADAPAGRL